MFSLSDEDGSMDICRSTKSIIVVINVVINIFSFRYFPVFNVSDFWELLGLAEALGYDNVPIKCMD